MDVLAQPRPQFPVHRISRIDNLFTHGFNLRGNRFKVTRQTVLLSGLFFVALSVFVP